MDNVKETHHFDNMAQNINANFAKDKTVWRRI